MNKFIMLKEAIISKKTNLSIFEGDYYLINVSQIIWIHPIYLKNAQYVELRFEDGSTLKVLNSKEEILEMMVLKPWWKNLIDAIRWTFIKKANKFLK